MTVRAPSRHCEERSDEAIHSASITMDCFAPLAMTKKAKFDASHRPGMTKGRDRSRPSLSLSLPSSCPAKAGHPVNTADSDKAERPQRTGSSGQAGRRQQTQFNEARLGG